MTDKKKNLTDKTKEATLEPSRTISPSVTQQDSGPKEPKTLGSLTREASQAVDPSFAAPKESKPIDPFEGMIIRATYDQENEKENQAKKAKAREAKSQLPPAEPPRVKWDPPPAPSTPTLETTSPGTALDDIPVLIPEITGVQEMPVEEELVPPQITDPGVPNPVPADTNHTDEPLPLAPDVVAMSEPQEPCVAPIEVAQVPEETFSPLAQSEETVSPLVEDQLDTLAPEVQGISAQDPQQELTQNQAEILKRYITLKENEVRDLRDQKKQYQMLLAKLTSQVQELTHESKQYLNELEGSRRREELLRQQVVDGRSELEDRIEMLTNDCQEALTRNHEQEKRIEELEAQKETWKGQLQEDLKRIRLKERELENKYELLKRDTTALIDSKDKHILELKKKLDALELELEAHEERLRKNVAVLSSIDSRKKRLIETLRLAVSLLEEIDESPASADEKSRKAG